MICTGNTNSSIISTVIVLSIAFQLKAQDNSDGLLITEARVAMEKYKDCKSAIKTLNKVSQVGQQQTPLFSYYLAKAYECLDMSGKALIYYKKFISQTSMTSELQEKIADLSYRASNKEQDGTSWEPIYSSKNFVFMEVNSDTLILEQSDLWENLGSKTIKGVLNSEGIYTGTDKFYLTGKIWMTQENKSTCENYTGERDFGTKPISMRISREKTLRGGVEVNEYILYLTTYRPTVTDGVIDEKYNCIKSGLEMKEHQEVYRRFGK